MTNGHSTHKNKGFAPQTPENDENDENGGCHARKDPVCQKPCFCTPDFCVFEFSGVWGSVGEMAGHNAGPEMQDFFGTSEAGQ